MRGEGGELDGGRASGRPGSREIRLNPKREREVKRCRTGVVVG